MTARQPPGSMANVAQDASFNSELSKIPGPILSASRAEMGVGDKDLQHYNLEEKVCAFRQRSICSLN